MIMGEKDRKGEQRQLWSMKPKVSNFHAPRTSSQGAFFPENPYTYTSLVFKDHETAWDLNQNKTTTSKSIPPQKKTPPQK